MMKGLKQKPCEEWLSSLGLFGLEEPEGRPRCGQLLMKGRGGAGADLSSLGPVTGLKLCQGMFRLDLRKRFFSQRVVGHWDRVLRDVLTAPA